MRYIFLICIPAAILLTWGANYLPPYGLIWGSSLFNTAETQEVGSTYTSGTKLKPTIPEPYPDQPSGTVTGFPLPSRDVRFSGFAGPGESTNILILGNFVFYYGVSLAVGLPLNRLVKNKKANKTVV